MREPPRKLDVREGRDNGDRYNIRVFFDDEEQKACTSYDQDKGCLTRYVMREDKDFPVVEGDSFKEETVYGKIVVEWVDPEKVIG